MRALDPHDPRFVAVQHAAAHLRKYAKQERHRQRKRENVVVDRAALQQSTRAAAYFSPGAPAEPAVAPPPRALRNERQCYVCKTPYRELHGFYHMLCPPCAERNFAARSDTADLRGRRAIVTGGRSKIGFEVARMLLAAGAQVTITTRFPTDARRRFAERGLEPAIVGLDFRDLRSVLAWIEQQLDEGDPLDILINNAAQTIWRPPSYYAALLAGEQRALLAGEPRALAAGEIDALAFPIGALDEEGKQLDLRPRNSWVLDAAEVAPVELVEAQVINAMAPFLLASRLRPLLERGAGDRFVVNVSAMEGVFAYAQKRSRHPHTNMAKAALNMFTRTSAQDYARDRIYMTSVDTGWITQENPWPRKLAAEARGFCPPLDCIDGAARILAPVWTGVRGSPTFGVLLKDFEPVAW